MNNEQMLHALRDKMSAELGVFEDWLLTLPPKEILEHTFEHNAKTNIVLLLDSADLSNEQLRVLLSSSVSLDDVYKTFCNMENIMDTIQMSLEDRADLLLKLQREKQRDTPEKKSVTERLHQKPPASSGPKHPPAKGDGAR